MNQNPSSGPCPRRWRRWGAPAAATGAGVTALVIWFEEVIAFAMEFIGVLLLPFLAGMIYLFNIYVFKSATIRSEDIEKK